LKSASTRLAAQHKDAVRLLQPYVPNAVRRHRASKTRVNALMAVHRSSGPPRRGDAGSAAHHHNV